MSIRSRISIPGGTCEFDLPAYYAWQQLEPQRAGAPTCCSWVGSLMPLAEALQVLLGLLRDSGAPHKVVAAGRPVPAEPAGRPASTSCCACASTEPAARARDQRPPADGARSA